jgi:hypothetical protein
MLERALNERVTVTENGKRKNITKLEAMFKQLANKAASGDTRVIRLLIPLAETFQGSSGSAANEDALVSQPLLSAVERKVRALETAKILRDIGYFDASAISAGANAEVLEAPIETAADKSGGSLK